MENRHQSHDFVSYNHSCTVFYEHARSIIQKTLAVSNKKHWITAFGIQRFHAYQNVITNSVFWCENLAEVSLFIKKNVP